MYHVPDTHFMPRASSWVGRAFVEQDPDGHWEMLFTTSRDREYPYVTGTNQVKTGFPAIEGLTETQLGSFSLLLIYPSTIVGVLPQGAITFLIFPQGVGRTNVTLNLYFTPAAFEMDDFDQHLREAQEGFIVTNNQDMHSARLTHRGMKSRLLPPGRFSHLERSTWELEKYVIGKVASLRTQGRGGTMIQAVDTGLPHFGRPTEWATVGSGILFTCAVPVKADGSFETGDPRKQIELSLANSPAGHGQGGGPDERHRPGHRLSDRRRSHPHPERSVGSAFRAAFSQSRHRHRGRDRRAGDSHHDAGARGH